VVWGASGAELDGAWVDRGWFRDAHEVSATNIADHTINRFPFRRDGRIEARTGRKAYAARCVDHALVATGRPATRRLQS